MTPEERARYLTDMKQWYVRTGLGARRLGSAAIQSGDPAAWYEDRGLVPSGPSTPHIDFENEALNQRAQTERPVTSDGEPRIPRREIVRLRRWEDLEEEEQGQARAHVSNFGGDLSYLDVAYGCHLDQAHETALKYGSRVPWKANYYSGPSFEHALLEASARRLEEGQTWPSTASAFEVLASSYAISSGSFKAPRLRADPNPQHDTCLEIINRTLAGESTERIFVATAEHFRSLRRNDSDRECRRTAQAAFQLLVEGKEPAELRTWGQLGKGFIFGNGPAAKVAAFLKAWVEPDGPDSFFVTDVRSAIVFMPHLAFATNWNVRRDYIGEGRGKHLPALHDYVARRAHAERGLSPHLANASFLNRGQAAQWGHTILASGEIPFEIAYNDTSRSVDPGVADIGISVELQSACPRVLERVSRPSIYESNGRLPWWDNRCA